jgi:hypothetical protein
MRSIGFGLLALGGFVAGQTPVGFKPAVSAHLVVKFGTKEVVAPGTAMTKAGGSKNQQDTGLAASRQRQGRS